MNAPDKSYPLIIVTGASGWLGRRLVDALAAETPEAGRPAIPGARLRCLVQPADETRGLLDRGIEVVVGDLADRDAQAALFKDAEGALVLHIAGIVHPPGRTSTFENVNHLGALGLYRAATAAKAGRFVAMSSNSPMGANPSPEQVFTEDSPYNPYMGYGRSKHRMELSLKQAAERPDTPELVLVRAPWFYGPGQPPRQTLFFSMIKDGKFPMMGKGLNRRSMGYVDSLSDGLILCGLKPQAAGRTYWIADERPYPMHEIIDTVRTVLRDDFDFSVVEKDLTVPPIIADCARIADTLVQAAGLYHQKIHVLSEMNLTIACDISRAKQELGYRPLVELREGMRRSIEWCLAQGLKI